MTSRIRREDQLYASCYCEENVFVCLRSQHRLNPSTTSEFTVAFLSNPSASIPLFSQRSSPEPSSIPVVWDYHVVLIHTPPTGPGDEGEKGVAVVYDLDSSLEGFPVPFPEYFRASFRPPGLEDWILLKLREPRFTRYVRLVRGDVFLKKFASTRAHMRNEEGGWIKKPPEWDVIRGEDAESDNTLPKFMDFQKAAVIDDDNDDGYGRIVNEAGFWREYMKDVSQEDIFGPFEEPKQELFGDFEATEQELDVADELLKFAQNSHADIMDASHHD